MVLNILFYFILNAQRSGFQYICNAVRSSPLHISRTCSLPQIDVEITESQANWEVQMGFCFPALYFKN